MTRFSGFLSLTRSPAEDVVFCCFLRVLSHVEDLGSPQDVVVDTGDVDLLYTPVKDER